MLCTISTHARDVAAQSLAQQGVLAMPSGVSIRESAQIYNPNERHSIRRNSNNAGLLLVQQQLPQQVQVLALF